jgi:uncharacterized membrane protein YjjB (DUF3815 family)
VIFPDSVTSLGNRVFFICTNLAGVYFEGNAPPPTWDWSVFEGVVGVTVYYRAGTTGWGSIYE